MFHSIPFLHIQSPFIHTSVTVKLFTLIFKHRRFYLQFMKPQINHGLNFWMQMNIKLLTSDKQNSLNQLYIKSIHNERTEKKAWTYVNGSGGCEKTWRKPNTQDYIKLKIRLIIETPFLPTAPLYMYTVQASDVYMLSVCRFNTAP